MYQTLPQGVPSLKAKLLTTMQGGTDFFQHIHLLEHSFCPKTLLSNEIKYKNILFSCIQESEVSATKPLFLAIDKKMETTKLSINGYIQVTSQHKEKQKTKQQKKTQPKTPPKNVHNVCEEWFQNQDEPPNSAAHHYYSGSTCLVLNLYQKY